MYCLSPWWILILHVDTCFGVGKKRKEKKEKVDLRTVKTSDSDVSHQCLLSLHDWQRKNHKYRHSRNIVERKQYQRVTINPSLIYTPIIARLLLAETPSSNFKRPRKWLCNEVSLLHCKMRLRSFNVLPDDLRLYCASIPTQWLSVWVGARCHLPPHGSPLYPCVCVGACVRVWKCWMPANALILHQQSCPGAKTCFVHIRETLSSLAKGWLCSPTKEYDCTSWCKSFTSFWD